MIYFLIIAALKIIFINSQYFTPITNLVIFISTEGLPEFQVFRACAGEKGIAQKEAEAKFDAVLLNFSLVFSFFFQQLFKIGLGLCMKNKWLGVIILQLFSSSICLLCVFQL